MIQLFRPPATVDKRLMEAIGSGEWASGPFVRELEMALEKFTGYNDVVCVSSGTMAARILWEMLGKTVLAVPALTFVSPVLEAMRLGFKIRVVDVDPVTWNMDTKAADPGTSFALLATDYAGYPLGHTDHHQGYLPLRDASHRVAKDMDFDGWSAAIFSFHPTKNLYSLGGGALALDDGWTLEQVERARRLRDFGRLHGPSGHTYDVIEADGTNGYMTNVSAAVALGALESLETRENRRRHQLAPIYHARLPKEYERRPFSEECSYHFFPILLPEGKSRSKFIAHMSSRGVEVGIHYPMLHRLKVLERWCRGLKLPVADAIGPRIVSLPCHDAMDAQDVKSVIAAAKDFL